MNAPDNGMPMLWGALLILGVLEAHGDIPPESAFTAESAVSLLSENRHKRCNSARKCPCYRRPPLIMLRSRYRDAKIPESAHYDGDDAYAPKTPRAPVLRHLG
ncbi:hypothetical protein GGR58DRAFT_141480 [Xylaria digitata]|nr:hypothetical protein GGR58DRAFT_141480 [Xylaria digitata]